MKIVVITYHAYTVYRQSHQTEEAMGPSFTIRRLNTFCFCAYDYPYTSCTTNRTYPS